MIATAGARLAAPFRLGQFRVLFGATTLSVLGDYFSYVAVAWLVLQLTGSALQLGSVLMASAIPRALLVVFGGAATDRLGPRFTMLASAVARAVVMGVLAALALTGTLQLWELYVLFTLVGAASAFFMPARQATVPTVVEADALEPANALLQLSQQGAGIAGPALAGICVALFRPGTAIAVDAACYAATALLLPVLSPRAERVGGPSPESVLREVAAGFRYVARVPALGWILAVSLLVNFALNGPLNVGLAVLVRERFHADAAAYGLALAGFGAGAVVGAVAGGALRPRRMGRALIGMPFAFAVTMALLALAPNLSVVLLACFLTGVPASYVTILAMSWVQRQCAPEMQGRLMALILLSSVGLGPISFALAGALAQLDPAVLFGAGAGLLLATGLACLANRRVLSTV